MIRAAIVSLPLLLLAACGDTTPPAANEEIEVRGEDQNALFELSDMNRDITMRRAITAAGYPCDRVTGSGFVGPYESTDMWIATCDDRREWAIFTGADNTAQVRYCPDLQGPGLPACTVTQLGTGIYAETDAEAPAEG